MEGLFKDFKKMIDISEQPGGEGRPSGGEDDASLSVDQWKAKCRKLETILEQRHTEYQNLLSETEEVRHEYDNYRHRNNATVKQLRRELSEQQQRLEEFRHAASKGGEAAEVDAVYVRGLEDQLGTLKEQNTNLLADIARLEKRLSGAEIAKARLEDEKKHALASMEEKVRMWKDLAEENQRKAEEEVQVLRDALDRTSSPAVELQGQLDKSTEELAGMSVKLRRAEEAVEMLKGELDRVKHESGGEHRVEGEDLRVMVAERDAAITELQVALEELRQRSANQANVEAQLRKELEAKQEELGRVQQQLEDEKGRARWEAVENEKKLQASQAKVEELMSQVAAKEAVVDRLEVELREKESEKRSELRKAERQAKLKVSEAEAKLKEMEGLLETSAQEAAREIASEEQLAHEREVQALQQRLLDLEGKNMQLVQQLENEQERLRQVHLDLEEVQLEGRRREETLSDLYSSGEELRQRLVDLEIQNTALTRSLQVREEELSRKEAERHALQQRAEEAEEKAAASKRTSQRFELAAAEAEREVKRHVQKLQEAEFEISKCRTEMQTHAGDEHSTRNLLGEREEQVDSLRQMLHEKDNRIADLLRVKDDQAMRLREAEKRLDELGGGGRSPKRPSDTLSIVQAAVDNTMSPGFRRPPPQGQGMGRPTWNTMHAMALIIIACLLLIGMYNTQSTSIHIGAEENLKTVVANQERALAKCRALLPRLMNTTVTF